MTSAFHVGANVDGFFREIVESAAEQESVESTDLGLAYVTSLLASYVRLSSEDRALLGESLTLALHRAVGASGAERFERLRSVGDAVLYASGFFAEHLSARGVSLPYVRGLGARAYGLAAGTLTGARDLFQELADRFDNYARLLGAVSDTVAATSAASTPAGTLRLYERWMRTGSPAAADALIERGLLPVASKGTLH
ncbi:MAG: hypothetical protein GX607_05255 [Myxococcales bacterium]|nr:hypothetical protein [Myxococcales bacterium]